LIIIGPPKSGRTTTAVALGVEALLRAHPPREVVVYTTFCKLLDSMAEEHLEQPTAASLDDAKGTAKKEFDWLPEAAELLIVDEARSVQI
jgi:hypothetical protein